MIALILVGGEGARLRPLTYDTPKPMLPIVERPIIARIVEWLSSSRCRTCGCCHLDIGQMRSSRRSLTTSGMEWILPTR